MAKEHSTRLIIVLASVAVFVACSAAERANGQDADGKISAMEARLFTGSWAERAEAASKLGMLGDRARSAIPALCRSLEENLPKPGVSEIVTPEKRWFIEGCLEAIGMIWRPEKGAEVARSALPAVRLFLARGAESSWRAVDLLGEFGPEAKGAEDALVAALEKGEKYSSWRAAWALGRLGSLADKEKALPALVKALDKDKIRPAAFEAIELVLSGKEPERDYDGFTPARLADDQDHCIGPKGSHVPIRHDVNACLEAVRTAGVRNLVNPRGAPRPEGGDLNDLGNYVFLLPSVVSKSNEALPILGGAMAEGDPDLRWISAWAAGFLEGKSRQKAVSSLLNTLLDGDFHVMQAAAMSLGRTGLGGEENLNSLVGLFRNPDHRECAAWACAEIGPPALPAVPWLVKNLGDESVGVRWKSAHALGRMGPGTRGAIKALEKAGEDPALVVRLAAEEAVRKIKGG